MRYRTVPWALATITLLLFAFQNCGGPSSETSHSDSSSIQEADIPNTVTVANPALTLDQLQAQRRAYYSASRCGPSNYWEVCFEGNDIPGHNAPSHQWWHNPIDDDWDKAETRQNYFRTNIDLGGGNKGLLVDRTALHKINNTGHFWRMDEFVTYASGVEAEFRFKVLPGSFDRSVSFRFFDDKSQFALHFSKSSVMFSNKLTDFSANPSFTVTSVAGGALDFADWRTIKVKKVGLLVEVWYLGRKISREDWLASDISPIDAGDRIYRFAQIGMGDVSNACEGKYESYLPASTSIRCDSLQTLAGAYMVDYFRYRRVVGNNRSPAQHLSELNPRVPDSAWTRCRPNVPSGQQPNYESVNGAIITHNWEECEFVSGGNGSTNRMPSSGPLVLEIRAKLNAAADRLTFGFSNRDGSAILTIEPNKISMGLGGNKLVTPVSVFPAGFDPYSFNTYRIVRDARGLYHFLYLNGADRPTLMDVQGSATSPMNPRVTFGNVLLPLIKELEAMPTDAPKEGAASSATIEFIQWATY